MTRPADTVTAGTPGRTAPPSTGPVGMGSGDLAQAARGFERLLLQQLTETLSRTIADDEGADAASSLYLDLLPQALADAVSASGGIGLAEEAAGALGGRVTG